MMILVPGEASLAQLESLWRGEDEVALHADMREPVEAAALYVRAAANGDEAVYGVNTGFGKLANVTIAADATASLQRNLILSHCCGVGEALDLPTTRLMMVLKFSTPGAGC